jgi:UPF0271 protein
VRVDLNADIGESSAADADHDAELLTIVTSASIACGFHAGDPSTMRRTIRMAASKGVAIGAHPGFADRDGFGRREMNIGADEIADLVLYQVGALQAIAKAEGVQLQHVKPHGALYNMAARRSDLAAAIARAVRSFDESLLIFGPPLSELFSSSQKFGLRFVAEGFADRAYERDGALTSRQIPGSVIEDPRQAATRALQIVREHQVAARDGEAIPLDVESICVHGDTPGAVGIAQAVRDALAHAGVAIVAPSADRDFPRR